MKAEMYALLRDGLHPRRGFCPVFLLGNLETFDFETIPVEVGMTQAPVLQEITERGLRFLGIAVTIDGVPKTALEEPLDAAAIAALTALYLRHFESALDRQIQVAALRRLWDQPSGMYDA